ncbi:hypothetical protein [Dyadobacter sp. LHD-138]|uniref:hypothetical protein n=1 Tax=Dyadobacter sp. LHD-138 TaxID=3071413 RepID=UPI0027E1455B|nr:hypothetical protein [Dyadobacter sp. LHD-138]MDQ6479829.1 hypothetical protein [Dyadobacter sp. LHD-138]
MNLNSIIQAWENNALPADLTVLDAYKKEIDNCEKHAFEAWRTTTNKAMAKMLMNELILYADVSVAILLEKSLKARETSIVNKYAVLTLSKHQRIILNGLLLYYTANFGENTQKVKDTPGCHALEIEHDMISEMLQELQFILS